MRFRKEKPAGLAIKRNIRRIVAGILVTVLLCSTVDRWEYNVLAEDVEENDADTNIVGDTAPDTGGDSGSGTEELDDVTNPVQADGGRGRMYRRQ